MKKTAIYARYSSHAQDGGTSIEVQLDACRRDLQPKTYREYVDRARTGRSMAGREALLRLLADAEAGQVERVLVYKFDRLGRNLAETSAIIAQLEDGGVEVASVTEGKDALARGMHLVISEHYSRVLSEPCEAYRGGNGSAAGLFRSARRVQPAGCPLAGPQPARATLSDYGNIAIDLLCPTRIMALWHF
jgi:predicted site-specific integrase-resolvase